MCKVSVIVPTFNRAVYLAEALDSVAAQTFGDWECVVIDDGSTDDTAEVVASYAERDDRFRYEYQENAGAAAARNHGVRLARAPFLSFLDSDDRYPADRLAWQYEIVERGPEIVLVYGETFIYHNGDPDDGGLYLSWKQPKPAGDAFEELISCSSIYAPMVRASAFCDAGGFDEALPSAEDWDMWLSISKRGRTHFEPRVHLLYRAHEGGKSNNLLRNFQCARRVVRKHLPDVPRARRRQRRKEIHAYFRRVYVPRLLPAAHEAGTSGRWPEARAIWLTLFTLDPLLLLRREALPNIAWAVLPTTRPPVWRSTASSQVE